MHAVWTMWLTLWRRRPVFIASRLSVDAATAALAPDVSSIWSPRAISTYGRWCVVGVIRDGEVNVRARRVGTNNSWNPRLEARFVPAGKGSALVGSCGTNPVVNIFVGLWLGPGQPGLAAALVVGIVNLLAERWSVERSAWGVFGFLSGFLAFGLALSTIGAWQARSCERFLRTWLADRLGVGYCGSREWA